MDRNKHAGLLGKAAGSVTGGALAAACAAGGAGDIPCGGEVRDAMKTITIEAKVERLAEVLSFVGAELEAAGCPMKTQMQIEIAVEELFVNIASYAYAPGVGDAEISVCVADGAADITFVDSGVAYDPVHRADPNLNLTADEREVGGLGIFMVKKTMDDMRYAYRDGKNVLTIRKKI